MPERERAKRVMTDFNAEGRLQILINQGELPHDASQEMTERLGMGRVGTLPFRRDHRHHAGGPHPQQTSVSTV